MCLNWIRDPFYRPAHTCKPVCTTTCPISFKQNGTAPGSLASVLHSPQWNAYATPEDKIYYVNIATQGL